MWFADLIMSLFALFLSLFALLLLVASFFAFDEIILRGYFATKLRKRFDVESLK